MKILVVSNQKYPSKRPMVTELWNREFPKLGMEVNWILRSSQVTSIVRTKWNSNKIQLIPITGSVVMNLFYYLIYQFQIFRNLSRYDYIHVHNGPFELIPFFLVTYIEDNIPLNVGNK